MEAGEVWKMLERAQQHFEKYQLADSELLLHRVLTNVKWDMPRRHLCVAGSLQLLAEIYQKRSRSVRHTELEWYCMSLVSLAMEQAVVEYCDSCAGQVPEEDVQRMADYRAKSACHVQVMEGKLLGILENRVLLPLQSPATIPPPAWARKTSVTGAPPDLGHRRASTTVLPLDISGRRSSAAAVAPLVDARGRRSSTPALPLFQTSGSRSSVTQAHKSDKKRERTLCRQWLSRMHVHCLQRVKGLIEAAHPPPPSEDTITPDPVVEAAAVKQEEAEEDFLTRQRRKYAGKIDFERVQTVTRKLVRQISEELRSKFIRKHLPEQMLRQSVSSEMICLLSPEAEDGDIVKMFENAIKLQERRRFSLQYDPMIEDDPPTPPPEKQPTPVQPVVETVEIKEKSFSQMMNSWDYKMQGQSLTAPFKLEDEPSTPTDELPYAMSGILRVWRSYPKNCSDEYKQHASPYRLHSFEEMSPLTEITSNLSSPQSTSPRSTSTEDTSLLYPKSPLCTDAFNTTLCGLLIKLADRCRQESEFGTSTELYNYALGLYQDTGLMNKNHASVAHILKCIGLIKCAQGDVVGGSRLMEESLRKLYHLVGEKDSATAVMETWLEMGNMFMQQNTEDAGPVFMHVMDMVRHTMEDDLTQQEMMDDDLSDSECSEGDSYSVSLNEAIGCYHHALAILRKMHKQGTYQSKHDNLHAVVLTKLGDASLMNSNLERAIQCYEEAMYLQRNSLGSTVLPNDAHVLVMLGISNFLIGNYPKAVSMYETAQVLQKHLYGAEANLDMAFTLSMLGITHYLHGQYYKSIAWCIKAYEIYSGIYTEAHMNVKGLYRWFIIHTLYVLGYSYMTLNFHDKALLYLRVCYEMITNSEEVDSKQMMRVLKVMADVSAAKGEEADALLYYKEALEHCQSLGEENSATTLQNQLLNSIANLHVTSKQYSEAAQYLEQALDYQRSVQMSIKGDLVGVLLQLGQTYVMSGEIDHAIDCYTECVESFDESDCSPTEEEPLILGQLGTLCHVKACIQEDNTSMNELFAQAEKYYKDAVEITRFSPATVQYANYLYQQGQYADALLILLPLVFLSDAPMVEDVSYSSVLQAVLPEHIQQDIEDVEELHLDTSIFACFLASLCCKHLGLAMDADECLVEFYRRVSNSQTPLYHSMLGYALMELGMYHEGATCFTRASQLQPDNETLATNAWLAHITAVFMDLVRGLSLVYNRLLPKPPKKRRSRAQTRDSGYYDSVETHQHSSENLQTNMYEAHKHDDDVSPVTEHFEEWTEETVVHADIKLPSGGSMTTKHDDNVSPESEHFEEWTEETVVHSDGTVVHSGGNVTTKHVDNVSPESEHFEEWTEETVVHSDGNTTTTVVNSGGSMTTKHDDNVSPDSEHFEEWTEENVVHSDGNVITKHVDNVSSESEQFEEWTEETVVHSDGTTTLVHSDANKTTKHLDNVSPESEHFEEWTEETVVHSDGTMTTKHIDGNVTTNISNETNGEHFEEWTEESVVYADIKLPSDGNMTMNSSSETSENSLESKPRNVSSQSSQGTADHLNRNSANIPQTHYANVSQTNKNGTKKSSREALYESEELMYSPAYLTQNASPVKKQRLSRSRSTPMAETQSSGEWVEHISSEDLRSILKEQEELLHADERLIEEASRKRRERQRAEEDEERAFKHKTMVKSATADAIMTRPRENDVGFVHSETVSSNDDTVSESTQPTTLVMSDSQNGNSIEELSIIETTTTSSDQASNENWQTNHTTTTTYIEQNGNGLHNTSSHQVNSINNFNSPTGATSIAVETTQNWLTRKTHLGINGHGHSDSSKRYLTDSESESTTESMSTSVETAIELGKGEIGEEGEEEEEQWETWETEETVVETSPELLAYLAKQQQAMN